MTLPTSGAAAVGAATIVMLLASGCASKATDSTDSAASASTTRGPQASAPADEVPNVDKQRIASLWDSIEYDYTPVDSSPDLAEDPEIASVVTGRVLDFAPGPIFFAETADDPEAVQNVVMSVAVDEVFKGDQPGDGTIYVRLDATRSLDGFRSALPAGTVVALYLDRSPDEGSGLVIGDEGAGRPEGEPLWQVGPQGFVVADNENDGVVFPIDPSIAPNAEFEQQVPPETVGPAN